MARGNHVTVVAFAGELPEPIPQCRIETPAHLERRIAHEQRLEHGRQRPWTSQRQHVAGTNKAAVAMRAAAPELSLIDYRNPTAGTRKIIGACRANDSAANDDHALTAC